MGSRIGGTPASAGEPGSEVGTNIDSLARKPTRHQPHPLPTTLWPSDYPNLGGGTMTARRGRPARIHRALAVSPNVRTGLCCRREANAATTWLVRRVLCHRDTTGKRKPLRSATEPICATQWRFRSAPKEQKVLPNSLRTQKRKMRPALLLSIFGSGGVLLTYVRHSLFGGMSPRGLAERSK